MRAVIKLMFSQVTIPTQQLKVFLGPSEFLQLSVEGTTSSQVSQWPSFDMIDSEEVPIVLPTANAFPSVGSGHLLSDNWDCLALVISALFEACRACAQSVISWQCITTGLAAMLALSVLAQRTIALVDLLSTRRATLENAVSFAAAGQTKIFSFVSFNKAVMGARLGTHVPIVPQVIG